MAKRPKISNLDEALDHIQRLAEDKRHRVLMSDEVEWLETKMKEILFLVKKAKKLSLDSKTLV